MSNFIRDPLFFSKLLFCIQVKTKCEWHWFVLFFLVLEVSPRLIYQWTWDHCQKNLIQRNARKRIWKARWRWRRIRTSLTLVIQLISNTQFMLVLTQWPENSRYLFSLFNQEKKMPKLFFHFSSKMHLLAALLLYYGTEYSINFFFLPAIIFHLICLSNWRKIIFANRKFIY